jgi:hypothetical protein
MVNEILSESRSFSQTGISVLALNGARSTRYNAILDDRRRTRRSGAPGSLWIPQNIGGLARS